MDINNNKKKRSFNENIHVENDDNNDFRYLVEKNKKNKKDKNENKIMANSKLVSVFNDNKHDQNKKNNNTIQKMESSMILKNIQENHRERVMNFLSEFLNSDLFYPRHIKLKTGVSIITEKEGIGQIVGLLKKKFTIDCKDIEEFMILENKKIYKKSDNEKLYLFTFSNISVLNYETWMIFMKHDCLFYSWINQTKNFTLSAILRFSNYDSALKQHFCDKALRVWPIIKERDKLEGEIPSYYDENIDISNFKEYQLFQQLEKNVVLHIINSLYNAEKISKGLKVAMHIANYVAENEILKKFYYFLEEMGLGKNNQKFVHNKLSSSDIMQSFYLKYISLGSQNEGNDLTPKSKEILENSIILPYYKLFEKFNFPIDFDDEKKDIIIEFSNVPHLSLNFLYENFSHIGKYIRDIFFYSEKFADERKLNGQICFVIDRKNTAFSLDFDNKNKTYFN